MSGEQFGEFVRHKRKEGDRIEGNGKNDLRQPILLFQN